MTMPTPMAAIVGSEFARNDPATLARYAIDGRAPAEIAMPNSAEEVVEIVHHAAAEKRAVIATGARTKCNIGNLPRAYHYAIDMSRMNRVVRYDPGDLTLSVEPGVTLAGLASVLAEHRQFLPLAGPFAAKATIGGTIASGVDSPLRQFYGTARDFLLGAEFVTGDGVLAKSGGRVVKNVTGYDMHKLMIGSLGSLGIITRLNFKTFPRPASINNFVASFAGSQHAIEFRNRLTASHLTPLSVELQNSAAAQLASNGKQEAPNAGTWTATCGFAGSHEVTRRYETELQALAATCNSIAVTTVDANTDAATPHAPRQDFVELALNASPFATIVKVGLVPTQIAATINAAEQSAVKHNLKLAVNGRSVGIIYMAFLAGEKDRLAVASACAELQTACDAVHGHSTIPWCPTEWKSALKVWGTARPALAEMKKLKSAFDPADILSPGRFVGGI